MNKIPFTIIPADQVIDVPEAVAVCPYCGAKLTVTCDGWVKGEDGAFQADSISVDCIEEPDMEVHLSEWQAWLECHSDMPYVYQLPVDEKIRAWLNANFRFDLERSCSTA
jgi:hypothetical protein